MTRLLIADDHALMRSGLRALLTTQPDFEVVGEAGDGVAVIEACQRLEPDVVLMDLTMPARGGIGAIRELRRACPRVNVLVVTMHEDASFARQAFLAGATGYVLKKCLAAELLTAIRTVRQGLQYVAPALAKALADRMNSKETPRQTANALELLTGREREVVALIALGHTHVEIGQQLHISEKTVETHRMHSMTKLGLRNRAELVRFALEYGLVSV
jgi:two-component system, NarL family, response regulator NreC